MPTFFETHRSLLERALRATRERSFWSPYPEVPSSKYYGEGAREKAALAYEALLGQRFDLGQPSSGAWVGQETSPFGPELGFRYPHCHAETLVQAAGAASVSWAAASPKDRVGVALELLARLNRQSFLLAHAVMHTSGQAFPMAFQAGGPHAQERALEAVAYAYEEMMRVPGCARWEKPQGKGPPLVVDKTYRLVPRGIGLVIGCSTFPTWNGYPGLFASLVTGNAVIVKPHPKAILPLALTVRFGREVLREAGYDPNVLLLAADEPGAPITRDLALHPGIGIVDFTGSSTFGRWLRENVRHAVLYTEEAGVNPVVIDSTDHFAGMCQNLAFSLSLYSGQMCTAPQNLFVPANGIATDEGHKSFEEVATGISAAVDALLADSQRAHAVLGTIQSEDTLQRVEAARLLGRIVRDSGPLPISEPGARTATPLIVAIEASAETAYLEERFGPISFVIRTDGTPDSLLRATRAAKDRGAITAALYSTSEGVIDQAAEAFARAGVALSVNLTGGLYVNQAAAFSDFHVTGANPAGTACLTDAAFVANRFRIATVRRPLAA
jgi:phenylacetic acid degradation protein paaN